MISLSLTELMDLEIIFTKISLVSESNLDHMFSIWSIVGTPPFSLDDWAKEAMEMLENGKRKERYSRQEEIKKAGYGIEELVKFYEDI